MIAHRLAKSFPTRPTAGARWGSPGADCHSRVSDRAPPTEPRDGVTRAALALGVTCAALALAVTRAALALGTVTRAALALGAVFPKNSAPKTPSAHNAQTAMKLRMLIGAIFTGWLL